MKQANYDVVVVGSGIGGLSTGALLSRRGYKVLVAEKRSRIGGRCSTEDYEGFKLPTGSITIHYHPAMFKILREVGVNFDVTPVNTLFYRIRGNDYEMPSKGSIRTMLNIANKLEIEKGKLLGGFVKALAAEKIMGAFRDSINKPPRDVMTFKDWLLQYTDNEIVHDIFESIASTLLGGHTYEIPAWPVFKAFASMSGFREIGITTHGNMTEMQKLADVVQTNGDVWTSSTVKRIIIDKGMASGVVIEKSNGEVSISSRAVVSNVGPKQTVDLTGEEHFDEKYLRTVRLSNRPKPVTLAFIASDRPLWPENGEPAILMLTGTRRVTTVVPISSVTPEAAPAGQHLLFAFGSPPSNDAHIDKQVEYQQVVLDIAEQLPLFEKHGRILRIEPRDIDDELPEGRSRLGYMIPPRTTVKNLLNVGCATIPSGMAGIAAIVISAKNISETVEKLI